ncbi:hypothetical protein GQ53DRAFT_154052 [Thozetella sp. PMI_491]|nr:hypothetical protein GQ53DRAFT_154052 [Thozetella sp. PMI_491]
MSALVQGDDREAGREGSWFQACPIMRPQVINYLPPLDAAAGTGIEEDFRTPLKRPRSLSVMADGSPWGYQKLDRPAARDPMKDQVLHARDPWRWNCGTGRESPFWIIEMTCLLGWGPAAVSTYTPPPPRSRGRKWARHIAVHPRWIWCGRSNCTRKTDAGEAATTIPKIKARNRVASVRECTHTPRIRS